MKILIALPGKEDDHLILEQNPSDLVLAIKENIQKHFGELSIVKDKLNQPKELDKNSLNSYSNLPESQTDLSESHYHLPETDIMAPEADKNNIKDTDEKKAELKSKLEIEYNVEAQILVYKRITLTNEQKIEDLGINEGAVINLYRNEGGEKVLYYSFN